MARPRHGRTRTARRGSRGQATVEFALVMPFVIVLVLLILQVGALVRDEVLVVHAAREAARAASVERDRRAAGWAAARVLAGAAVSVTGRPVEGSPVTVLVSYTSRTDLPIVGVLLPDVRLHARATMRVES